MSNTKMFKSDNFNELMEKERFNIKNIEVFDVEKTDDTEKHDNIQGYSISFQRWEGKIKYKNITLKFEYTDIKTEDNGGDGISILSKQPKTITDDEWTEIEEYVEEDYHKYKYNKKDYDIDWEG